MRAPLTNEDLQLISMTFDGNLLPLYLGQLDLIERHKVRLAEQIEELERTLATVRARLQSWFHPTQAEWQSEYQRLLKQSSALKLAVAESRLRFAASLAEYSFYDAACRVLLHAMEQGLTAEVNRLRNWFHCLAELKARILRASATATLRRTLIAMQHRWYVRHNSLPSETALYSSETALAFSKRACSIQ